MKGGLKDCFLNEGRALTFSPFSADFVLKLDSMSAILLVRDSLLWGFASPGLNELSTSNLFKTHDMLALMIVSDEWGFFDFGLELGIRVILHPFLLNE